jgi:hypothetical protein
MSENSSEVLSSSQPRVGALKAFFRAVFGLVISGVAIWIFPKIPVTRSEFGLKVALIIPLAALATIWVPFLTFCNARGSDRQLGLLSCSHRSLEWLHCGRSRV